jgi:hypothetical protein
MRPKSRFAFILALLAAGTLDLGCGGSPAGPSAGGATLQGTVETNAATASSGLHAQSVRAGGTVTISVSQTGQSTTTDSSGNFVLTGLPSGTITLKFTAPGIDATLEISGLVEGQTLTIKVHVSGSHAELTQPPKSSGDKCFAVGEKAEVEGDITGKGAATITVTQQGKGDYECEVGTATRIRKGNKSFTFADLAIVMHVHVSGTGLGASGSVCRVSADEVKIQ